MTEPMGESGPKVDAWCVLRNLTHTVYREARHLGPSGDLGAKVTVSGGDLLEPARRCQRARGDLKTRRLFKLIATATTVADIVRPYEEETGLSILKLTEVFSLPGWKDGYGGQKWRVIAETLNALASALGAGDESRAHEVAVSVSFLEHNNGRLIPSRHDWEVHSFLREKWPELCDC